MLIPRNFRYWDVLKKGRPEHEKTDLFRLRHPRMDVGHRAKIFMPFDALKGFSEALVSEEKQWEASALPETAAIEDVEGVEAVLLEEAEESPVYLGEDSGED